MKIDLSGKRVLVTAGASGIGLACARAFAEAGALVHVCDIDDACLEAAAKTGLSTTRADVSEGAAVDALFQTLEAIWGGLDVLVNNAGIAGPTKPVEDVSEAEWNATMGVNVGGQFLCARRAVPMMKRQTSGCIVNLSSVAGRIGMPLRVPYSTSKYAVRGLTDALAVELGGYGIRVNAILPGLIDGPRGRRVVSEQAAANGIDEGRYLSALLHNVSLHTLVSMEEIAAVAVFLASDFARSMTGQSISVCGNFETYRSPLTIAETGARFSCT